MPAIGVEMKIGYAQDVITPSLDRPVYLAGFGNNRRATTIHDDLYVRSLVIQDGENAIALVAIDLIGLFRPDVYEVIRCVKTSEFLKASKVSSEIIIASTHTHHGPDTMGIWGPDDKTRGVDTEYMIATKQKIVDTILASLSAPKPASIKWTSVHVPGLAKNARNPEIVDDELTLLQFTDVADTSKVAITLMNFPCHPEVLWDQNPNITSDYVGYLRADVEKQTGSPCIFFSGALGGMMTPDVKDHSFEEAEFMGRKLSKEGLGALGAVRSGHSAVISIKKKELKVKLTNILYKLAFGRKLLPDTRDKKGYITTEVNLIKIGDLWFATVPGELLPKLGLQLKAWMKEAGASVTGVIGLANDELGYIIPTEEFKYPWNPFKPGSHYEETNSISKEITPKVMDALKELIR